MECSICAHPIPEGKQNCLRCGAETAPVREQPAVEGRRRERISEKEAYPGEKKTKAVWSNSAIGTGVGYPTDPKLAVEFYMNQLMAMKSQRKAPLSKGIKVIIFIVSMLLGGIVVWLLK